MSATMISLFLLVLNTELFRGAFADHALPHITFSLCTEGYILHGASKATLNSRSLPDCADACFRSQDCGSFNFCPDDSLASAKCQLLADRDNPSCAELLFVSAASCRHGYQTPGFRLVPTQSSGTVASWTAGHISDLTDALTTISLTTPDETDTTQVFAEQATTVRFHCQ
ncbi:hypothetical protein V1264_006774 [Littorina saxatilis]|uniref:Apple domain-containing protein n=1 Tax=Littorina saxatilis TaxID=31220 RepID=A0AAN9AY52_9CAEN